MPNSAVNSISGKMKKTIGIFAAGIKGDVEADDITREMLATDASIFRVLPFCVVYPRNEDDVVKTIRFAKSEGFSIHSRGAGSGLCGSALGNGIVIDFSKYMNRLTAVDWIRKTFTCQPGYRLGELEKFLSGSGLFYAPDPSSGEYASFGGMFATNASGSHSVKYGATADYVKDARIVLASGDCLHLEEIAETHFDGLSPALKKLYRLYESNAGLIEAAYPPVRFNSAGYNLRSMVQNGKMSLANLFAGSEGTLAVTTEITFRLLDKPRHDSLVVAFFDDMPSSARASQDVLKLKPSGIEIMDKSLLSLASRYSPALEKSIPGAIDNVLLIEFDSHDRESCYASAEKARELCLAYTKRVETVNTPEKKKAFWAVRKAAVPILYKLKGKKRILAIVEDAVVPVDRLVDYVDAIYRIMKNRNVDFVLYGHIAKGLFHTRPLLDLKDAHDVALLKPLADDIFTVVNGLGGAVSGEHGDGRLRTPFVKSQYSDIYHLMLETKRIFDPGNLLNPDIITSEAPDLMSANLRFGGAYKACAPWKTGLVWNDGFEYEIEKCHGCSKCATVTTETRMCPVFKVTREEASLPKAKANALRALISGRISEKSAFEARFQLIMKRCIQCGSCLKECPSNVNIPKMVLEARSRYEKLFGAPLVENILANMETAGRGLRALIDIVPPAAKRLAGVLSPVNPDRFASVTGTPQSRCLPLTAFRGYEKVIFFTGCYASDIRPEIRDAAIKVLAAMGVSVQIPVQHCCGLPFLSKGMTDKARVKIQENIQKWGNLAAGADAVIVTCSSCGLALMQEWGYVEDSRLIRSIATKTRHISAFVMERLNRLPFVAEPENIAYHYPCHLKVQPEPESSAVFLNHLTDGRVEALKTNCCGMAGSFGMIPENMKLSKEIGKDLIHRVAASSAGIVATDCPTCRLRLEQYSGKPIVHPIEIAALCTKYL